MGNVNWDLSGSSPRTPLPLGEGRSPSLREVAGGIGGGRERPNAHRKVQEKFTSLYRNFSFHKRNFVENLLAASAARQGVFPTSRTTANDAVRATFAGRNLLG